MVYKTLIKEHIPALAEFYVEAFNAPPWNDAWTVEIAEKRLLQMLNCEGAYGLVCYEEEKLVGMILGNHEYYYNAIHFYIKEFCVEHKLQGKGVGSNLMEEFSKRLKEKGVDEIILFTVRDDKTQGFYKKREFKKFENMVIMGKSL